MLLLPRKSSPVLLQNIVFALALVGIGVFILLWGYNLPFPLLADDIISLVQACRLTSVEYGTLYELGYCGVVRLAPNFIAAFDIKQSAVIVFIGVLIIRFAQTYSIPRHVAACCGLWVVLSIVNINGTAYTALVVVLLGVIVAKARLRWQRLIFSLFLTTAFLIRTEYLVGLVSSVLVCGWQVAHSTHTKKQQLVQLVAPVACTLFCSVLFVVSRYLKQSTPNYVPREWFAFGQHFAENYQRAYATDSYAGMEWPLVVGRFFPHSHSVFAALRENPAAFGWHIWFNLRTYLFSAVAQTLSPLRFGWWAVLVVAGLGALAILGVRVSGQARAELAPLVVLALVPAYSVLIIQPKPEYLLPILPVLIVLVGRGITYCLAAPRRALHGLVALCSALLVVGFALQITAQLRSAQTQRISFRADVVTIQTRASQQPFRVLASWYANRVCALVAPLNCQPLNFVNELAPGQARMQANESLAAFIRRERPDWIVVGEDWQTLSVVQHDPELRDRHAFLAGLGCAALPETNEGLQTWRCTP